MTQPHVAPYGSWKSPITSELIVAGTVGLGQVVLDGDDVYWTESRPTEAGRSVVVRSTPVAAPVGGYAAPGASAPRTTDVTPAPFNVRSRVHEYGGSAYTVARVQGRPVVYFSNFVDQRVYRQPLGADPEPITPADGMRYADFTVDQRRGRLICVREDHSARGEPVNTIVSLSLGGEEPGQALVSGSDFYSSPRLSGDGRLLAWLTWNHPNMPWDSTELWVGEVSDDGSIGNQWKVAGAPDESVFQPEWSPDGRLYFVSDRTGWWNLYRWQEGQVEALHPLPAEFGLPQWVFGMSTYGLASERILVGAYTVKGSWQLARLDAETGELEVVETPYTQIGDVQVASDRVVFIGGSPTEAPAVVQLDLATRRIEVLRRSSDLEIDEGYLSTPEAVEFPTERRLTAHGFFYPPKNRDFVAPDGERPPLLVVGHGGPTGATTTALRLPIQFWTSRGIAVLDVNYGGSTGYGRPYRERLKGQWGVVDVEDCVNGARYLAGQNLVDPGRMAIRGGSAGGYTALAALTFHGVFTAGASYYGVSDLEALAKETHKFEERYLDTLVGPYPERRDLYQERSPIHHVERLDAPVIFFQGLEDKVVPPNQAEMMVDALRAKGVPVAYVPFEGEQHGFRRAENIKRALDAELYFYSRVFGFPLAEPVEPVKIENLG